MCNFFLYFTDALIYGRSNCNLRTRFSDTEGLHNNLLCFRVSILYQNVTSFNITVQDPLSVIRSIKNIDMPVTGNFYSVQVKFDTLRLSDTVHMSGY